MHMNGTGKTLSVFTVMKAVRRRKLYLLIPVLLLTAGAVLYALWLPPRFRARALVAAEPVIPQHYLNTKESAATVNVQDQMRSIRETLFSRSLLETVVRENKLYDTSSNRLMEQAIEKTKSRIDIQVEGPDAFYLGFEGGRAQQAMDVTNRLAQLFTERTADLRGRQVQQAASFLDAEVARLRKQLNDQEEREKAYKQGAIDELPTNVPTNLKLLENLQLQAQTKADKIAEDQARRAAVVDEIQTLEKHGGLSSPVQSRERSVTESSLEDLRLRLAQLKTRYTEKHPEILRTEKEIHDLESRPARSTAAPEIRAEPSPTRMRYFDLKAELQSIDERLKSYRQERAEMASGMQRYERRIRTSPQHEMALAQLERDLGTTRSEYEALLSKQQEAKLDQQLQETKKGVTYRVVEEAQLPLTPYSPKRLRIILLGFLASLGLGIVAVLFAEQADTSLDTVEDLKSFTNLPILASIPNITARARAPQSNNGGNQASIRFTSATAGNDEVTPGGSRRFQEHRIAVLSNRQSVPAEQYGILALKVQQLAAQDSAQVLVVTSAASGEGKSLTAANLSLMLSRSVEGRVLLVDGDLRRPRVHEWMELKQDFGFSNLLLEPNSDIYRYVSKVGNLYVMPGGTRVVNPVGLLASRRTSEVLARLRKEFRFIVMDTPPIMPVADAHILAGLADAVVIVVRARQTQRELLQRAIESLAMSNAFGVVLNDVQLGDTRYAYAYHYQQRHSLVAR